ncbi:hypothetical protein GIB67_010418 [Kingdonia uniflora]|uniref:Piwi domain-containing protein n=1 Tax=Kingdonia uniflora TaxID=39325 RepID=A0A7J7MAN3_9MAGN|nr:hypothetical protein GIB67_010418 [Kingdonia uniflora]
MTVQHLKGFYKANGHQKPSQIIFYRDGVSEGQFSQVLLYEVCQSIEPNYLPRLTFVVVQKRHHTLLCTAHDRNSDRKGGNIMPGTVVETMICHPTEFDFYLYSVMPASGYERCICSVSIVPPGYYAHLASFRARYYIEDNSEETLRTGSQGAATPAPLHQLLVKNDMFYY